MHIVTDYLLPTEPCYGAMQGPVLMPMPNGSQEERWVERVFVVRGDAIAKHERDLGEAKAFEGCIQSRDLIDGDITVQEVLEQLEQDRTDFYWARRKEELRKQSNLIQEAIAQTEERHRIINNRSVMGPMVSKQRNGFSRQTVDRYISQRRQDYYGIIPQRGRHG